MKNTSIHADVYSWTVFHRFRGTTIYHGQISCMIATRPHVIGWCWCYWVSKSKAFFSDSYNDEITQTPFKSEAIKKSALKFGSMSGSLSLSNIFDVDWKIVRFPYRKLASHWLFALNVAQSVTFGFAKMPKLTQLFPRTVSVLKMRDHSVAI